MDSVVTPSIFLGVYISAVKMFGKKFAFCK